MQCFLGAMLGAMLGIWLFSVFRDWRASRAIDKAQAQREAEYLQDIMEASKQPYDR